MTRYRKTALVSAEQFLPAEGKIPEGVYSSGLADPRKSAERWMLRTLEGEHLLRSGDYICTGPAGERWNVARDIFEATYEPVCPAETGASISSEASAGKEARDEPISSPTRVEGGELVEDIADNLRALSNDMANAGVKEQWWRPVYDEAVKLEALPAPVEGETP